MIIERMSLLKEEIPFVRDFVEKYIGVENLTSVEMDPADMQMKWGGPVQGDDIKRILGGKWRPDLDITILPPEMEIRIGHRGHKNAIWNTWLIDWNALDSDEPIPDVVEMVLKSVARSTYFSDISDMAAVSRIDALVCAQPGEEGKGLLGRLRLKIRGWTLCKVSVAAVEDPNIEEEDTDE